MTITAKFASVCPCCAQRIQPGSKVEWSKGSKARHVACAVKPGAAVASGTRVLVSAMPRASYRGGRRTGCSCGSIEGVSRDSDCRQCRFDEDDC